MKTYACNAGGVVPPTLAPAIVPSAFPTQWMSFAASNAGTAIATFTSGNGCNGPITAIYTLPLQVCLPYAMSGSPQKNAAPTGSVIYYMNMGSSSISQIVWTGTALAPITNCPTWTSTSTFPMPVTSTIMTPSGSR